MYGDPEIEAMLERAARRNNASPGALRSAVERESAPELALALRIPLPDAEQRIERLRRMLAVDGDWGAGCRLLSDELRMELLATLQTW